MRQKRLMTLTLEAEVQRLKAENQRLVDKCIQFGLEIAIRDEEDRFKRGLLPACWAEPESTASRSPFLSKARARAARPIERERRQGRVA